MVAEAPDRLDLGSLEVSAEMIYQLVIPDEIDWKNKVVKVTLNDTKLVLPMAFGTTSIFNRLKSQEFYVVIIGNTTDDAIAIPVYRSTIVDGD